MGAYAGAHRTWFHLYRLVLSTPEPTKDTEEAQNKSQQAQHAQQARQVALAVEQFLQTSTVGEFSRRLEMVWSFRSALLSLYRLRVLARDCEVSNLVQSGHDSNDDLYHTCPPILSTS